jgi:hypothetical protein
MAERTFAPPEQVLIELRPNDQDKIALNQKVRRLRSRLDAYALPPGVPGAHPPFDEPHRKPRADSDISDGDAVATARPTGRRRTSGPPGTAWIIALACVTALAAVIAMVFTGLQWWEIHTGFAKAERQATLGLVAAAQTQANAARDAVAVAKEQAIISRDMLALTQKTADTQQKAAVAAALDSMPSMAVDQLQLSGLRSPADRHGKTRLALHFRFANIGKQVGYLEAISTGLYIGKDLPPRPTYETPVPTSMELPPGSAFMNTSGANFERPAIDVQDVIAGRKTAFVTGYVDYKDGSNGAHRLCFAYALDFKGQDASQGFNSAGSAAYRCDGAQAN